MKNFNSNLIINADDFGFNSNINAAIVYCILNNIINSTTIMVNTMGFEEAVELAKKFNFQDKIGIHINLSHGKPLTDLSGTGLLNDDGILNRKSLSNPYIYFSTYVKNKIKNEIIQQYDKLRAFNIDPTHIDSHHSVHTIPWIANLFIEFVMQKNKKIRISHEQFRKNLIQTAYSKFLNQQYKKHNINFSDKLEKVSSFTKDYNKLRHGQITYEVMVHPGYDNNVLIDTVDLTNLEDSIFNLKKCIL